MHLADWTSSDVTGWVRRRLGALCLGTGLTKDGMAENMRILSLMLMLAGSSWSRVVSAHYSENVTKKKRKST